MVKNAGARALILRFSRLIFAVFSLARLSHILIDMNANDKTMAGSKAARNEQTAKSVAWEARKAAEIASLKAALAAKLAAFEAA